MNFHGATGVKHLKALHLICTKFLGVEINHRRRTCSFTIVGSPRLTIMSTSDSQTSPHECPQQDLSRCNPREQVDPRLRISKAFFLYPLTRNSTCSPQIVQIRQNSTNINCSEAAKSRILMKVRRAQEHVFLSRRSATYMQTRTSMSGAVN